MKRIHPPTAVLFIVLLSLTIVGFKNTHEQMRSTNEECSIVETYLDHAIANISRIAPEKKIAFQLGPERVGWSIPTPELLAHPDFGSEFRDHPFLKFYQRLELQDGQRVVDVCPALINAIEKTSKVFVDRREGMRPVDADEEFDEVLLSISMPAVAPNRQEAILLSGIAFAPLGGGGAEVYLRKNHKGKWWVVYEKGTWIS